MNSLNQGKDFAKQWIKDHKQEISSILDIGAGCGTYYDLLKNIGYEDSMDAVEVWHHYIEKYNLRKKYKIVYDIDVRGFTFKGKIWDLIIFGDILEHLTTPEAIKTVYRAKEACKYYIISIPISYCPQNAEHGNHYQEHLVDNYTSEKVKDYFGPFIIEHYEFCRIGRYGKLLNRPIDLGVYIGTGKLFSTD